VGTLKEKVEELKKATQLPEKERFWRYYERTWLNEEALYPPSVWNITHTEFEELFDLSKVRRRKKRKRELIGRKTTHRRRRFR
jgi:hypothetical protein